MFRDPREVLGWIGVDDRVLDLGGAADVFPRADVVIDALPWERRTPSRLADVPERFTRDSWVVGDVCDRAVWKRFGDKSFDFVVCSHILEDVRDPIFLCSQLVRVARAGYIECPSRFRECARSRAEDVHAGWGHHRWIVDLDGDRLVFTPKLQWADLFDYLGDARRKALDNFYNLLIGIRWTGSFDYVERTAKGCPKEAENLFHYYDHYPYDAPATFHTIENAPHRGVTFEWETEFQLPIERVLSDAEILARFRARLDATGQTLPGM